MPLFSFARFFTSILSLLIVAAAAWLLWSWYEGQWAQDALGNLVRVREPWRLWSGLGLGAWSFLGGRLLVPLLARRDKRPTGPQRGDGRMIDSPSGARLYVESFGPAGAPPIVFTHGWGMDSTFWRYAREDLAQSFRVIAWDLAGLGRSKLPADGDVDLRRFAQDLRAVIEQAAPGRPVLVGHSIGGMIIQTLLRDDPDVQGRLAGVALLNTTYTNPLKTMILSGLASACRPVLELLMRLTIWLQPLAWLIKWQSYLSGSAHLSMRLGFASHVTRGQLEHATLLSARNPPAALAHGNLAMFRWDAAGALKGVRIPVLVVGGDKDIVTKLEAGRAIACETPFAELKVADGANHMGPMERADLYDAWIADFVLAAQPAAIDRRPERSQANGADRDRPTPDRGRTDEGYPPSPDR